MDETNDPKVYVAAVAAVLSRYPADIGARLTDPKDGIAGKLKWLPSISEIREACDGMQAADVAAGKRKAELHEQFRLRDEFKHLDETESPEHRASVVARVRAEMRAEGFKFQDDQSTKPTQPWKRLADAELEFIYGKPPAPPA